MTTSASLAHLLLRVGNGLKGPKTVAAAQAHFEECLQLPENRTIRETMHHALRDLKAAGEELGFDEATVEAGFSVYGEVAGHMLGRARNAGLLSD